MAWKRPLSCDEGPVEVKEAMQLSEIIDARSAWLQPLVANVTRRKVAGRGKVWTLDVAAIMVRAAGPITLKRTAI